MLFARPLHDGQLTLRQQPMMGTALLEDTLVEGDIHPEYFSAAVTHVGRVRDMNQDAFVDRVDALLWAVADGMGGHAEGDVASRMVCDALADLQPDATLQSTVNDVQRRLSQVNTKLYAASIRPVNPVLSGTTVVAFVVKRTACAILWAGDSRVYRLRHRQLLQLTIDHTWAAQMLPEGEVAEPDDHSIMRAVGGEDALMLDVRQERVRLGDRYLLCSDGLTRELTSDQIATLLGEGDIHRSTQALLDATLAAGARDNVTIVVIEAR